MARNTGYFVAFTDKEGNQQLGRTQRSFPPVNGKFVVFYLDNDLKFIWEEIKGKREPKKRLLSPDRVQVIGFID